MSVANVAAVDAALVGLLAADAQLATLLPDGVFLDVAPAGKTRFAIVQHQTHHDEDAFRMTVYEEFRYRITARVRETSGVDANAAAYRIHTLLQDVDLAGVDGYTHMATLRVERIKFPEVDAIDNDIRWQIAGGDYEITVSPGDPVPPAVSYADQVIADGAIHYWRLGESAGTITVDSVGEAHGTITGGVTRGVPGAIGDGTTAMMFDGTGTITTQASVPVVTPTTVEVWFRAPSIGGANFAIWSNHTPPDVSADQFFVTVDSAGFLTFQARSTTGMVNGNLPAPIAINQWYHLAMILRSTTIECFINGMLTPHNAGEPFANPIAGSTLPFKIGHHYPGWGVPWIGHLDEIAIYPHALTPAQIAAHYTAATTARASRTRTRKD